MEVLHKIDLRLHWKIFGKMYNGAFDHFLVQLCIVADFESYEFWFDYLNLYTIYCIYLLDFFIIIIFNNIYHGGVWLLYGF